MRGNAQTRGWYLARPSRTLFAITCFWATAAVVAGASQFLAGRTASSGGTFIEALTGPVLAGLIWIPITTLVIRLCRRFPPVSFRPGFRLHPKSAAGHVIASLSATFVLNGVFLLVSSPRRVLVPEELAADTLALGLSFMHLNTGVYWAMAAGVVAVSHMRQDRREVPPAENAETGDSVRQEAPGGETLAVRSGRTRLIVPVRDIRWIEGAGDYARLHVGPKNHLHSERLKTLEKRLDPTRFVRVHRSAIVNLAAVREVSHLGRGDYEALLDDGTVVRVSRTRRARLAELLGTGGPPGG